MLEQSTELVKLEGFKPECSRQDILLSFNKHKEYLYQCLLQICFLSYVGVHPGLKNAHSLNTENIEMYM